MRSPVLIMLAIAATACTTTAQRTWRPDAAGPVINVTGTRTSSGETRILFDDQVVLEGEFSTATGKGLLTGSWEGKPVTARCGRSIGAVPGEAPLIAEGTQAASDGHAYRDPQAADPNFTPNRRPGGPTSVMRDPDTDNISKAPPVCVITVADRQPFSIFFRSAGSR